MEELIALSSQALESPEISVRFSKGSPPEIGFALVTTRLDDFCLGATAACYVRGDVR